MYANPITADLPPSSPAGRLLALVRKLWDYGMQISGSLQRQPPTTAGGKTYLVRTFGISIVKVIIIRIALGMKRARFLAERIARTAEQIDAGSQIESELPPRAPRARTVATEPRAQNPRYREPPPDDEALALMVRLPTLDQIARKVLRQPIGAILADICRDLGISRGHELWDELHAAITEFGGSLVDRVKTRIPQAEPVAPIVPRLEPEPTAPGSRPEPRPPPPLAGGG